MKKCPRCVQPVPLEAAVCHHCRSNLLTAGPDWWKASDGLMYPPWQHPDAKRPERPPFNWKLAGIVTAGFVALLVLAAVFTNPEQDEADQAAVDACEEYGDLADRELYTFEEEREQVQQVWDDARFSDNPAIRSAARRMLAGLTSGDLEGYAQAGVDMGTACESVR